MANLRRALERFSQITNDPEELRRKLRLFLRESEEREHIERSMQAALLLGNAAASKKNLIALYERTLIGHLFTWAYQFIDAETGAIRVQDLGFAPSDWTMALSPVPVQDKGYVMGFRGLANTMLKIVFVDSQGTMLPEFEWDGIDVQPISVDGTGFVLVVNGGETPYMKVFDGDRLAQYPIAAVQAFSSSGGDDTNGDGRIPLYLLKENGPSPVFTGGLCDLQGNFTQLLDTNDVFSYGQPTPYLFNGVDVWPWTFSDGNDNLTRLVMFSFTQPGLRIVDQDLTSLELPAADTAFFSYGSNNFSMASQDASKFCHVFDYNGGSYDTYSTSVGYDYFKIYRNHNGANFMSSVPESNSCFYVFANGTDHGDSFDADSCEVVFRHRGGALTSYVLKAQGTPGTLQIYFPPDTYSPGKTFYLPHAVGSNVNLLVVNPNGVGVVDTGIATADFKDINAFEACWERHLISFRLQGTLESQVLLYDDGGGTIATTAGFLQNFATSRDTIALLFSTGLGNIGPYTIQFSTHTQPVFVSYTDHTGVTLSSVQPFNNQDHLEVGNVLATTSAYCYIAQPDGILQFAHGLPNTVITGKNGLAKYAAPNAQVGEDQIPIAKASQELTVTFEGTGQDDIQVTSGTYEVQVNFQVLPKYYNVIDVTPNPGMSFQVGDQIDRAGFISEVIEMELIDGGPDQRLTVATAFYPNAWIGPIITIDSLHSGNCYNQTSDFQMAEATDGNGNNSELLPMLIEEAEYLGVKVWWGSRFGHIPGDKWTVDVSKVNLDAKLFDLDGIEKVSYHSSSSKSEGVDVFEAGGRVGIITFVDNQFASKIGILKTGGVELSLQGVPKVVQPNDWIDYYYNNNYNP